MVVYYFSDENRSIWEQPWNQVNIVMSECWIFKSNTYQWPDKLASAEASQESEKIMKDFEGPSKILIKMMKYY